MSIQYFFSGLILKKYSNTFLAKVLDWVFSTFFEKILDWYSILFFGIGQRSGISGHFRKFGISGNQGNLENQNILKIGTYDIDCLEVFWYFQFFFLAILLEFWTVNRKIGAKILPQCDVRLYTTEIEVYCHSSRYNKCMNGCFCLILCLWIRKIVWERRTK